jgi:excisionase family DNA binding protein
MSEPAPLMTAAEVAAWFNVSPSTILDWHEQGKIPSYPLGRAIRFDRAELEAWLAEKRRAA